MRHNVNHHSNHDTVILYRSRGEQMTDEFLWEEGGIVYIFGLMLATVAIAIAYEKIRTTWRNFQRNRLDRENINKRKFDHAKWR